ncbi:MAG TPA: MarR family transcriptional regulator [Glaciihabitans sp.]|jgi:DNA-binding MarR family transcriptional regulator|nr:MarR family transcriptional regulator [Glaciihabitans sp.]
MDEVQWLDAEQLLAWKKFVAVVELLPGVLDTQLQKDAGLTHFEYFTLAMLSEAPEHTLRMTALAAITNSTLPRLSHVASRLESRGFLRRSPCPEDRRATNATLTDDGWQKVSRTAPGHVRTVRDNVIDALDERDLADLDRITGKMLTRLDPHNRFGIRDIPTEL